MFERIFGDTDTEARIGESLRETAVAVAEAGVRGYRWLEPELEKVADLFTGIYQEAVQRVDNAPAAEETADDDLLSDSQTGESVASEAESFLRDNGQNGTS